MLDFNARHLWSSRQKEFAVVRRQRLSSFIIEHLFKKRIADTVNDATADLSFDEHRIDHFAAVVSDYVTRERKWSGRPNSSYGLELP
jgi:hypothetical protein